MVYDVHCPRKIVLLNFFHCRNLCNYKNICSSWTKLFGYYNDRERNGSRHFLNVDINLKVAKKSTGNPRAIGNVLNSFRYVKIYINYKQSISYAISGSPINKGLQENLNYFGKNKNLIFFSQQIGITILTTFALPRLWLINHGFPIQWPANIKYVHVSMHNLHPVRDDLVVTSFLEKIHNFCVL